MQKEKSLQNRFDNDARDGGHYHTGPSKYLDWMRSQPSFECWRILFANDQNLSHDISVNYETILCPINDVVHFKQELFDSWEEIVDFVCWCVEHASWTTCNERAKSRKAGFGFVSQIQAEGGIMDNSAHMLVESSWKCSHMWKELLILTLMQGSFGIHSWVNVNSGVIHLFGALD